jgi:hypothetical protein
MNRTQKIAYWQDLNLRSIGVAEEIVEPIITYGLETVWEFWGFYHGTIAPWEFVPRTNSNTWAIVMRAVEAIRPKELA